MTYDPTDEDIHGGEDAYREELLLGQADPEPCCPYCGAEGRFVRDPAGRLGACCKSTQDAWEGP